MSNIVSLNFDKHSHLKVQSALRHSSAINQHLMPVVPSEFGRVASCFPIVLTKNADTGQFVFSAMMGFEPGENLFVKQGVWDAGYEPLHIQRQPFFVGGDGDDRVLCFDAENAALSPENGEPLFTADSQPSDYLQTVQHILQQLIAGEDASAALIAALRTAELLTSFAFDIEFKDGSQQCLSGAYTIDEQKLAELDDPTIVSLQRSGHLALIHCLQGSMHQLPNLIVRKNVMLENAKSWFQNA